jgi:hypothetical protein
MYPEKVAGLSPGSSGLYESVWVIVTQKKRDYEYIKKKQKMFLRSHSYPDLIDEVYATVNDRIKLIKTLTIAKSAIRHNMAKDLPKMHVQTVLFGKMIRLHRQM